MRQQQQQQQQQQVAKATVRERSGRAAPGGYCQQRLAHSNRAICVHMHNHIVNEHTHTRFEVVTSRIFLSINSPSLAVYKK